MQTLLSPATYAGTTSPTARAARPTSFYPQQLLLRRLSLSLNPIASPSLSPPKSLRITHHYQSLPFPSPPPHEAPVTRTRTPSSSSGIASSSASSGYTSPTDASAKFAQVAKRLEATSRHFKRLGSLGFWCQLVCTVVGAVILSFSVIVTGKITSPATFYATAGGIASAFVSVFFSFGYIRLSEKLKRTANDPTKAPPRADVVKSLKNSIAVNVLGMGAAILGMQATVGSLVAKALTSTANPYFQGIPPGSTPVLAIDVFLVQAAVNIALSHFLGIACSLELLRSVTLPSPGSGSIVQKLV